MFIKLNRHRSAIVRWLQSALIKDPILEPSKPLVGIQCGDFTMVACDGKRIHAVDTDVLDTEEGEKQLVEFHPFVRAGENIVETEEVYGKYPNLDKVVPTTKPMLTIAVQPRFLVDCLKAMSKEEAVVFKFYGDDKPFEIFGAIQTGFESTPVYAMVMPLHIGQAKHTAWKPDFTEPEEVEEKVETEPESEQEK